MFVIDSKQLPDGTWTTPFGFIGHPKTGSQACRKALREQLKARNPAGHHNVDQQEVADILDAGGIVCSTVRNPWDLMVSWYGFQSMMANNSTFPEMVPFERWLPRILEAGNGWIEKGLFYGAMDCNRIIKFEYNIEKQLNQALSDCGLTPVTLEVVGNSPRTDYQDYYTPALAIMVERRFQEEIVEWGYNFEDKV